MADYWFSSNNQIRVFIAQAFKQVVHYVPRLERPQDTFGRLKIVLESNDPTARALTFDLFSYLAGSLVDDLDFHHRVFRVMNDPATDELEMAMALSCALQLAKNSRAFASSFLQEFRGSFKIWQSDQPIRAAQLLAILQQTGHDMDSCTVIMDQCQQLWSSEQDPLVTRGLLRVATMTSTKCILFMPDHVVEAHLGKSVG